MLFLQTEHKYHKACCFQKSWTAIFKSDLALHLSYSFGMPFGGGGEGVWGEIVVKSSSYTYVKKKIRK